MENAYIYRIDSKDRVDFVSAEWLAFARENGMREPTTVFGNSIWDYMTPGDTASVYREIYTRVRKTRKNEMICFRCDGPSVRRMVELEIRWLPGDGLEHFARVVQEEKRQPLVLLDPSVQRSNGYLTLCAWCGLVQVYPRWIEAEEAVRTLGLAPGKPVPNITHGICPACADVQLHRIARAA